MISSSWATYETSVLSPLEKVIFTKTCHWLSISYKDKKYDSGLFQVDSVNNLQKKIGLSIPGKTIGIPTGVLPTHTIDDFLKRKLPELWKDYYIGYL